MNLKQLLLIFFFKFRKDALRFYICLYWLRYCTGTILQYIDNEQRRAKFLRIARASIQISRCCCCLRPILTCSQHELLKVVRRGTQPIECARKKSTSVATRSDFRNVTPVKTGSKTKLHMIDSYLIDFAYPYRENTYL